MTQREPIQAVADNEWKTATPPKPTQWPIPEGFRTDIEASPGYDCPRDTYGIADVTLYFHLIGPRGAVTLSMSTGWYPDSVSRAVKYHDVDRPVARLGRAVSLHIPCEESNPDGAACAYTSTGFCRGDASYLASDAIVEMFVREGLDAVWRELHRWHEEYEWPQ